jgi:hypothetical protein
MKKILFGAFILSAGFIGVASAQQTSRTAILMQHDGYKEIRITEPDGKVTNIHVNEGESTDAKYKEYIAGQSNIKTTQALSSSNQNVADRHLLKQNTAKANAMSDQSAAVTSKPAPLTPNLVTPEKSAPKD